MLVYSCLHNLRNMDWFLLWCWNVVDAINYPCFAKRGNIEKDRISECAASGGLRDIFKFLRLNRQPPGLAPCLTSLALLSISFRPPGPNKDNSPEVPLSFPTHTGLWHIHTLRMFVPGLATTGLIKNHIKLVIVVDFIGMTSGMFACNK